MAITTTSDLPAAVQQDFAMRLLAVPTPNYIYKIPAMKDMLRKNHGPVKRYRRYNPLGAAKVPLGNSGQTPPSSQLTNTDIDARIDYYADWLEFNEQVVYENQESVLNEAAIRLGEGMRLTEDQLVADMLAASAASRNCVNGLGAAVPTNISGIDINLVVKDLLGANAKMFLKNIEGDLRFDTQVVRPRFLALCNTDMIPDLERLDGFTVSSRYPNQEGVLPSEWGSYRNMAFLVSSEGYYEESASDIGTRVYNVTCVAQESYACISLEGSNAEFIYRPKQYSGPLAQNVTMAYKFKEVPRILNEAWVVNLRATIS